MLATGMHLGAVTEVTWKFAEVEMKPLEATLS